MTLTAQKLVGTCALLACGISVVSEAQRLGSAQTVVDQYRVAIQRAQKLPSRGRLEAAFNSIEPLRDELQGTLKSLSQPEFDALRRRLTGLHVNREESVFIEPDLTFFVTLAARGDAADRAFFEALSATHPRLPWPVYIEQQTDFSGCTRFGSGTLVTTYLTWSAIRRQYPRRYTEASERYLGHVRRELASSTCACSDRDSVEAELTTFLRRAETSEFRDNVTARLAAVRSGQANIRFQCLSG